MKLEERNQLIEKHLPWVRKLAKAKKDKMPYPQISVEELVSAGNKALVEIADKYEESKGDFPAFAKKRILGEMTNELSRCAHAGYRMKPVFYQSLDNQQDSSLIYYDDSPESLFDIVAMALPDPKKNGLMLRWYFIDDLTFKQIGERLGLTESRVSQMFNFFKRQIRSTFSKSDLV